MGVNMTLSIPDDLHKRMRHHKEIKWAEVARRAFQQELDRLEVFDKLLDDSGMTDEKAVEWGRRVRRGAAERARLWRQAHTRKETDEKDVGADA